jgi:hypothetical protein
MRRPAVLAFVLTLLVSPVLVAQWPRHAVAGLPRGADGRPNMGASAPRMPDGKPDLSGVWENPGWRELQRRTASGTGGNPGQAAVLTPDTRIFFDIGSAVTGGLPFRPWAADLRRARMASNSQDNPDAHCLPLGHLQLHTHPEPRKIVQTPTLIVILYEANAGVRQIFLDGRRLPDADAQPWWFGYSVGRWEGDALVVESSGFRDEGWLDVQGSPLSDKARIVERFTRRSVGTLDIAITVDDPKAYTKPWTVDVRHALMADDELIEFVCAENEKSSAHYR